MQHHPVFKGVTFACANPFSGGLAGTIATVGGGAVTDTIVYGSLDAAAGLIGQVSRKLLFWSYRNFLC